MLSLACADAELSRLATLTKLCSTLDHAATLHTIVVLKARGQQITSLQCGTAIACPCCQSCHMLKHVLKCINAAIGGLTPVVASELSHAASSQLRHCKLKETLSSALLLRSFLCSIHQRCCYMLHHQPTSNNSRRLSSLGSEPCSSPRSACLWRQPSSNPHIHDANQADAAAAVGPGCRWRLLSGTDTP